MIEAFLAVLEQGHFEIGEAFRDLADEHVWVRPAEGLLSIGEIAGHVVFWEAVRLAGEGSDPWPDLEKCRVKSPLLDPHFRYYDYTIAELPTEELRAMTAQQVSDEVKRIHQEAVADFTGRNPDPNVTPPGWAPFWTNAEMTKYLAFHIAYHTGQIYSARYLLGENPPDN